MAGRGPCSSAMTSHINQSFGFLLGSIWLDVCAVRRHTYVDYVTRTGYYISKYQDSRPLSILLHHGAISRGLP